MDNPCFDDDSRKTVYTIERLPEVPAKPLPQNPNLRKSKVATLAAALLLGTIIVLITTAALVYTLRTVHTNYRTSPTATSTWAAEMIVSGEFRITNEPFRSSLYNLSSPDFKQLSKRIEKELAGLFGNSQLWQEVQGVAVTSLSPGLQVRCSLTLQPKDSLTIGKVGLSFLAGLNHSHGHLWLGPFSVDVLSIGFQARTEEVSWSQWSDWSDCQLSGEGDLVRKRRRVCLSLDGLKLSRSEPCQAISKPLTNDTESQPCQSAPVNSSTATTSRPITSTSTTTTIATTSTAAPSRSPPTIQTLASVTEPPATMTAKPTLQPSTTTQQQTTAASTTDIPLTTNRTHHQMQNDQERPPTTKATNYFSDKGSCLSCAINEVCVALEDDPVPLCRIAADHSDPTGCGGLCQINTEVCHRLGNGAFRCVDDSKCLDNEWQCGNSLCIPYIKRCDGHFNCYDHTDEHNCDCDLKTHFQCGKNLSCLPQSKRCDGIVDCWDAADESNCTIACLDETQFTCNDSQCIPSKNFCDGFVDCKDHSDEPFGCGGVCKNHEWRCNNGRCIVKRDVCNGHDDCGDNSDEIKCGKRRGGRI